MAALTITAANVTLVSGSPKMAVALGTVSRGMTLYRDTTTPTGAFGLPNLGAADANVAGKDIPAGIALADAAVGQVFTYAGTNGDVIGFGAILTVNACYIVGATTAGDLNPIADITTGWKLGVLGFAKTTSQLTLQMFASEVAS